MNVTSLRCFRCVIGAGALFLAGAVLLTAFFRGYPASADAAAAILPGDADGNGRADENDAALLRMYLLGEADRETLFPGADYDGNGTVDARDLVLLQRALAGSTTTTAVSNTTNTKTATGNTTTTVKPTTSTTPSRTTTSKTRPTFDDTSGWGPLRP